MASLRDVAQLSGVSVATASHVINNRDHNMSEATRERVLDAIRTLGYRPGSLPTDASERMAHSIGVFIFLGEFETPLSSNPYAVQILDGILATAMPRHWNVTLISVHAWEDARAQVRLFVDGRCDGFILIAPRSHWGIKDALVERGYPCVLINGGADALMDTVDVDNTAAAREMTQHLLTLGHRLIAFLPGGEDLADSVERIQGFRQAFIAANLPDPDNWVLRPGSYDMKQSLARLHQFLDQRASLPIAERPTALFCGNDQLAAWASEVMHQRGISVPEEISLVGFDDLPLAAQMNPPLTTICQPRHQLGVRATQLLLERIRRVPLGKSAQKPPVAEILPHQIILRDSVVRHSTKNPSIPTHE